MSKKSSFLGKLNMTANLKPEERVVVEELKDKMAENLALLERVTALLAERLTDETVKHLGELSCETRVQACVEHLVIGLLSGDVRMKEVKALLAACPARCGAGSDSLK